MCFEHALQAIHVLLRHAVSSYFVRIKLPISFESVSLIACFWWFIMLLILPQLSAAQTWFHQTMRGSNVPTMISLLVVICRNKLGNWSAMDTSGKDWSANATRHVRSSILSREDSIAYVLTLRTHTTHTYIYTYIYIYIYIYIHIYIYIYIYIYMPWLVKNAPRNVLYSLIVKAFTETKSLLTACWNSIISFILFPFYIKTEQYRTCWTTYFLIICLMVR